MIRKTLPILFILLSLVSISNAKTWKLYYLGGQSNMDGQGYVSELSAELNAPVPGVMIFNSQQSLDNAPVNGKGLWSVLQPGNGTDFQSDGVTNQYGKRFGVELTFARELQKLEPDANIAIIKYSRGGSSIDTAAAGRFGCWDPDFSKGNGVNQYDHFLATLRNALSVQDIDGDGEADTLIPAGIIWMQGESDACWQEPAQMYEQNLKRLMDLIRAALRVDDLPVVIGRISDSGNDSDGKVWDFGDVVRKAQADFCASDACAALVTTTDNYGYSDTWHYDSAGYIDLGRQFARAVMKLQQQ